VLQLNFFPELLSRRKEFFPLKLRLGKVAVAFGKKSRGDRKARR